MFHESRYATLYCMDLRLVLAPSASQGRWLPLTCPLWCCQAANGLEDSEKAGRYHRDPQAAKQITAALNAHEEKESCFCASCGNDLGSAFLDAHEHVCNFCGHHSQVVFAILSINQTLVASARDHLVSFLREILQH